VVEEALRGVEDVAEPSWIATGDDPVVPLDAGD